MQVSNVTCVGCFIVKVLISRWRTQCDVYGSNTVSMETCNKTPAVIVSLFTDAWNPRFTLTPLCAITNSESIWPIDQTHLVIHHGPEQCETCLLCRIPPTGAIQRRQAANNAASSGQDAARQRSRPGVCGAESGHKRSCDPGPAVEGAGVEWEERPEGMVSADFVFNTSFRWESKVKYILRRSQIGLGNKITSICKSSIYIDILHVFALCEHREEV